MSQYPNARLFLHSEDLRFPMALKITFTESKGMFSPNNAGNCSRQSPLELEKKNYLK